MKLLITLTLSALPFVGFCLMALMGARRSPVTSFRQASARHDAALAEGHLALAALEQAEKRLESSQLALSEELDLF